MSSMLFPLHKILSHQEGILFFSEVSYVFVPGSYLYVGAKHIVGSSNCLNGERGLFIGLS